jgi:hypothetical protein
MPLWIRNAAATLIVLAGIALVPTGALWLVEPLSAQTARPRKLLPRDDRHLDPSFAAFSSRLSSAAGTGDVIALRNALAPDIMLNFEPSTPQDVLAAFRVMPGAPWRKLRDALQLGIVRVEDEFVAPYVSGPLPDGMDWGVEEDVLVVLGANVRVRILPMSSAAVIDRLSYDVVRHGPKDQLNPEVFEESDQPSGPTAWAQIVTPAGAVGYVYGRFVRSPSDWRFYFARRDGRWMVTAIVAGD